MLLYPKQVGDSNDFLDNTGLVVSRAMCVRKSDGPAIHLAHSVGPRTHKARVSCWLKQRLLYWLLDLTISAKAFGV